MSVGIECPVCEAVFLVKEVGEKTGIRCPECKRKFRYSVEFLTSKKPATEAISKTKASRSKASKHPAMVSLESDPVADNTHAAVSEASTKKQRHPQKSSKWKTEAIDAPRLQTVKPAPKSAPQLAASDSVSDSSIALDQLAADTKPSQLSGKFELGISESKSDYLATIHARKKEKSRRQTIYATATVAILSIVTAVLGMVLYRQLNMPADPVAGQTRLC